MEGGCWAEPDSPKTVVTKPRRDRKGGQLVQSQHCSLSDLSCTGQGESKPGIIHILGKLLWTADRNQFIKEKGRTLDFKSTTSATINARLQPPAGTGNETQR